MMADVPTPGLIPDTTDTRAARQEVIRAVVRTTCGSSAHEWPTYDTGAGWCGACDDAVEKIADALTADPAVVLAAIGAERLLDGESAPVGRQAWSVPLRGSKDVKG